MEQFSSFTSSYKLLDPGQKSGSGKKVWIRPDQDQQQCSQEGPFSYTYPWYLSMWKDEKGPAAARLHNNGEELGVDGAEGGVPGGLGHADVVITLLPLQVGPEHVAELGLPHHAEGHLVRKRDIRGTLHTRTPGWPDSVSAPFRVL
jgi:hypothetical protein